MSVQMFLIDDYVCGTKTPWSKIRTTLEKLANIATEWDQDGVDLAFINANKDHTCLNTDVDVLAAFDRTGHADECTNTLTKKLDVTLSSYVQRFKEDRFTKPLNMIIITSGDFMAHDRFEETVMEWAKELDSMVAPKSQLGLQFVLVGCKEANIERFRRLDESMYRDYGVRYVAPGTCGKVAFGNRE